MNEQLATSPVEQFWVKFMPLSTATSKWAAQVLGLAETNIDAKTTDPDYISVQMLVEQANNEYIILVSLNCQGPSGKTDNGNTLKSLLQK